MGKFQVYLVTCLVSGKSYVGQTTLGVGERFRLHVNMSRRPSAVNLLSRAIAKYGPENFRVEVIHEASSFEEMCEVESQKIRELGTLAPGGYNLTDLVRQSTASQTPESRELSRSRRRSRRYEYKGQQLTLRQLVERFCSPGVTEYTLWARVHNLGWSVESAVDNPLGTGSGGRPTGAYRIYEFEGEPMSLSQLASACHPTVSRTILAVRLRSGWRVADAVRLPAGSRPNISSGVGCNPTTYKVGDEALTLTQLHERCSVRVSLSTVYNRLKSGISPRDVLAEFTAN